MYTVFPTGTTIYKPEKCFNGYTLYPSMKPGEGAILIDMNGNPVRTWPKFDSFMVDLLPGGTILGGQTGRVSKIYNHTWGADDVVQEAWDGGVEWRFNKADEIDLGDGPAWSARQNHDLVREGCPVGYYVPGMTPMAEGGSTLMLSYRSGHYPEVTRDYLPRATRMIEVSWDGEITWDWMPAEQFEQFDHSEAAKNAIMRRCRAQHGVFQNTISYVGPNKWFDTGDTRFDPENIITDDRGTMLYIISKKTGEIVWKVGPDYSMDPALKALGTIIGAAPHTHDPQGTAGRGQRPGLRQWWCCRFRRPKSRFAGRHLERAARLLARPGDQSRYLGAGLGMHRVDSGLSLHRRGYEPLLQPLQERGAAPVERQHADYRKQLRPAVRGHGGRRDRLGVRQPTQSGRTGRAVLQRYLPRLPLPL